MMEGILIGSASTMAIVLLFLSAHSLAAARTDTRPRRCANQRRVVRRVPGRARVAVPVPSAKPEPPTEYRIEYP